MQMELLTEIRNLNSKLSGVKSGSQSNQPMCLAYDVIKPIYAGMQFAIRKQQNYIQRLLEDYDFYSKVPSFRLLVISLPKLFNPRAELFPSRIVELI